MADHLPPPGAQPLFLFDLPELLYPDALNAAAELIDAAVARGWGERVAIAAADGELSYGALLGAANQIARVLVEDLGLVAGGRVLLLAGNGAPLAACWLAVLKAGGVAVTTMPMLRAGELAPILGKAHVDIAIADDALMAELADAARDVRPGLRSVTMASLMTMARGKATDFANARTHRDDPCLLAFTSGTTGASKACVHFHRDVLAMADTFASHVLKPSADDIFVATPPMAFTFGLGGALVFPLRVGAATSFPGAPGVEGLVAHIAEREVSVLFTAPTSYRQILARPASGGLESLRRCVSAGEPLDRVTSDAWFARTGLRLIDGIGSTEMMHIFISAAGDDIRPGSTGKPVPGFKATILDDQGAPAPIGVAGRLAVRGPTGCRYLDDPRQGAYVENGWNLTGDTFQQDEDGYFWFVARADDMIISSGYNIAAPEVEAAVLAHPLVAECAVVAWPDRQRGHIAKAFVVLKAPVADEAAFVADLQAWVKSAIAPYKYPRAVEIIASLPKTATGKIQRYRLRRG